RPPRAGRGLFDQLAERGHPARLTAAGAASRRPFHGCLLDDTEPCSGLYVAHTRPAERPGAFIFDTRESCRKDAMTEILMPKATAVWLVDNTSLTFEQIADFCGLHPLEVKGIADGEVARDIRGADPIANGQLSREELDAAQKDSNYRMKPQKSRHAELLKPVKKGPRYTPVSRPQDRPHPIAW